MALRQAGVLGLYGACALALALARGGHEPEAGSARSRVDRLTDVLGAEVEASLRVLRPLAARLGDVGEAGGDEGGEGGRLEWREFARLADSGAVAPAPDSGRLYAWVPHVPAAERTRYEEGTGNDGYRSFRVTDLDARGRPVTAATRSEHFPVHLVAPSRQGDALLGLDLAGHPDLRAGIARARTQRAPGVVGPLHLRPHGACGQAAPVALCDPQLVVILPVSHGARGPAGVLVAVLPWHALAAAAGDAASDARASREAVSTTTARLLARQRR
jgi:hypothetical protein